MNLSEFGSENLMFDTQYFLPWRQDNAKNDNERHH